ncbi:M16 family metallopeptidase [Comamonas jiangduensis]|uniref:M16 family metallopeptidase n=1 Tax=Comamonas jiangduensis TaxID=1194168 RepID=UPI0028A59DB1|nr:pitrilysin family protein [Comamonas jiangduensis]
MMKTKTIAAGAWLACILAGFGVNSAWAVLPIQHWQQASGAKVWLVESPSIPMVDIQVAFDAGARREPQDQAGLATALAMMTDKGVKAQGQQPALDENALGEAWADLGASFDAGAGKDSFNYSLRSLTVPDLLQRSVQLAARQIAHPSLPADVWQRDRARWSASIAESNTRPGTVAGRAFTQAVYGGHPYGWRTTEQTLAKIDVKAIRAFHDQYIQACRAKVSVVGAVDKAQADALVTQLLSQLPKDDGKGCQPLPVVAEVPALKAAQDVRIPFQSAQAQVLIGQPGIKRSDPDFLALLVGDHILGGGGLVSRLMEEVREKRGLTYGVSSSFSPGLHAGAFVVSLQTRPDQAEQARQVAQETLAKFVAEGPTEQELRDAKDNLIGSFALRIDSNRKLLANVANIAWNDLPLDYLDHWTDKIEALTANDVRSAMQRAIQPDRMVTVVLGEKK